jgi:hypothetical protein
MGTTDPCFFWNPAPGGTLEITDLAEAISDIQDQEITEAADARNGYGTAYRNFLMGSRRVRIVLERFGSPGSSALERDFYAIENHLRRGGYVGFSRNRSKSWCGAVNSAYAQRGDTVLYTGGNLFNAWYTSAALASGDEVIVESANPDWQSEPTVFSSITGTQVTVSRALRFTYPTSNPIFVRYRDFYPVLRLPDDQLDKPLVTHDKRITWTFDALLEYDLSALASAIAARRAVTPLSLSDTNTRVKDGSHSLESLLYGNLVERSVGGSARVRQLFGGT